MRSLAIRHSMSAAVDGLLDSATREPGLLARRLLDTIKADPSRWLATMRKMAIVQATRCRSGDGCRNGDATPSALSSLVLRLKHVQLRSRLMIKLSGAPLAGRPLERQIERLRKGRANQYAARATPTFQHQCVSP